MASSSFLTVWTPWDFLESYYSWVPQEALQLPTARQDQHFFSHFTDFDDGHRSSAGLFSSPRCPFESFIQPFRISVSISDSKPAASFEAQSFSMGKLPGKDNNASFGP